MTAWCSHIWMSYVTRVVALGAHSYICMYIHICDINVCVTTRVIHIEMRRELEYTRCAFYICWYLRRWGDVLLYKFIMYFYMEESCHPCGTAGRTFCICRCLFHRCPVLSYSSSRRSYVCMSHVTSMTAALGTRCAFSDFSVTGQ